MTYTIQATYQNTFSNYFDSKKTTAYIGFAEVGLDEKRPSSKVILFAFFPSRHLSIELLVLNFNNIFSISSGYGQTECYFPNLHKALLVSGIINSIFQMDKYQETFKTWDKIAFLYQEKFMNLDIYDKSYEIICNSLDKSNPKILEIGCGPGNISRYFLSKRPDFEILGIDAAPAMIDLAKRNNPSANFQVMDCREIDKLEAKFDGIICGFCLPYLSASDTRKLIEDSSRLLNEKGLIYLSFVEGQTSNSGFKTASTGDKVYFYYHDLQKIKADLSDHNFLELAVNLVEFTRSANEKEIHTIVTARKTIA